MIRGITVTLHEQHQTGSVDELGNPVYELRDCVVDNVLVAPVMGTEATDTVTPTGRKAVYTLGIPKGDTHNWEGGIVEFFGETFDVIGAVTQGIEALIPLDWNRKVQVARIES